VSNERAWLCCRLSSGERHLQEHAKANSRTTRKSVDQLLDDSLPKNVGTNAISRASGSQESRQVVSFACDEIAPEDNQTPA
jgi:transcriptional/translational regulatory protein YebC/TACO1